MWKINKVLKGGSVCAVTHQSWPVHEQPWDFWRFSECAWKTLFNKAAGFEIDSAAMGEATDIAPRIMNDVTGGFLIGRGVATTGEYPD